MDSALLTPAHLSLIDGTADGEIARIRSVVSQPVLVEGRGDIEAVLGRLADHAGLPTPKTLDLIGHSTSDRSLLAIGDWVVDGTSSKVLSFFRGLIDCEVLSRLGVTSLRLLGCETALSEGGRHTLTALSEITEVEVFGTTLMISSAHYDLAGFRDDCSPVLLSSKEIRTATFLPSKRGGEPYRCVLDIDTLPGSPLAAHCAYPRRLVDTWAARGILTLIRRTEGAQMPGLLASPTCELALPSARSGWFHRVQVLMDGEFVRAYPNGEDRPGVVFPVDDPGRLRSMLAGLPLG